LTDEVKIYRVFGQRPRNSFSELEQEGALPQEKHHSWLHRWLSRIVGIALLAGVVIIATHFSEHKEFFRLAREAKLSWLLLAILLQAGTYFAQGRIWTAIGKAAGRHLPFVLVYKLALAKLFVDQALPSAGISGTVVVAQVLEKRELPRPAVLAGVVINTTSFFMAYATALLGAALVLLVRQPNAFIFISSLLFVAFCIAVPYGLMKVAGKDAPKKPGWLVRNHVVQNALNIMQDADPELVRNRRLQFVASIYQLLTFILDASTLWLLIASLGYKAWPLELYASYMVSNVVRTVSFVPGGLGTFEGALLLLLRRAQVPVSVGLASALLFRGLTFFLPMIPGFWFSHRLSKKTPAS
jgi:Mg2+-importing ATPase